jgi:peptidoglycan/LPS O-acetylase OafA/YrhL
MRSVVWPPLLLLLGRRAVVPLALAAIAISTAFREAGGPINLLASQADGFALGGLLAWLRRRERNDRLMGWAYRAIVIGGPALMAVAFLTRRSGSRLPLTQDQLLHPGLEILAVNLFYFGVIGAVSRGSGNARLAFLRWAPLVFLGQISYGLYLYHPIVGWLVSTVAERLGIAGPWLRPLLIPVFIAVAAASWRWFEQPILRLKDRFDYERASSHEQKVLPQPVDIEEAAPVPSAAVP